MMMVVMMMMNVDWMLLEVEVVVRKMVIITTRTVLPVTANVIEDGVVAKRRGMEFEVEVVVRRRLLRMKKVAAVMSIDCENVET